MYPVLIKKKCKDYLNRNRSGFAVKHLYVFCQINYQMNTIVYKSQSKLMKEQRSVVLLLKLAALPKRRNP